MPRKTKITMTADDGMKITIETDKRRDYLIIGLAKDGKSLAQIRFAASDAEALLLAISEIRAGMKEQVVPELEPMFRIAAIEEPAWRISDPAPDGHRILALRHPGFGWLGFLINQDRADAISRGLRA
jgi:hypothetical protein